MKKCTLILIVFMMVLLLAAFITMSCQGESNPEPTPTPTVQVTSTPPIAFEFPDIPEAEGVSGEDSLADLMGNLDQAGGKIESKDYLIKYGGIDVENPHRRIDFEVKIKGSWFKGDETRFEQKRDAFLAWFAERRTLLGADCQQVTFSTPEGSLMRYTNPDTKYVIDRNVNCPLTK